MLKLSVNQNNRLKTFCKSIILWPKILIYQTRIKKIWMRNLFLSDWFASSSIMCQASGCIRVHQKMIRIQFESISEQYFVEPCSAVSHGCLRERSSITAALFLGGSTKRRTLLTQGTGGMLCWSVSSPHKMHLVWFIS